MSDIRDVLMPLVLSFLGVFNRPALERYISNISHRRFLFFPFVLHPDFEATSRKVLFLRTGRGGGDVGPDGGPNHC